MRQIRQSVFETNSSSSHSIAIKKENDYVTKEQLEEEFKWKIWDKEKGLLSFRDYELEFGRSPFEALYGFYDKLRFVIASMADNEEDRKVIEEIMFKYIPDLKVLKYPTRYNYDSDEDGGAEPSYGYIDHQSCGLLQAFLANHDIGLEEFLTNNKYIVFIDGDEYNVTNR
jgi:hypothetical protein